MSLMNWFEDKRRFGGLIGASIEKATKGYILSERKKLKVGEGKIRGYSR